MVSGADKGDDLTMLVRGGDYDRFLCIQLAPAGKRLALYAVTALHIELARIAETVSEPLLGHIRLAWWREALDEIAAGTPPRNHPVVLALAQVVRDHPTVLPWLRLPIEARGADLDESLIALEPAWLEYLDHTAGALHMAWAMVLDAPQAVIHTARIGDEARAYAMVGLARAIPYMHGQGFLRFAHARMNAQDITTLAPGPSLQVFVRTLLTDAKSCMRPVRWKATLRPLRGLSRLTRLHAKQLEKLQGNPYHLRPATLSAAWAVLTSI